MNVATHQEKERNEKTGKRKAGEDRPILKRLRATSSGYWVRRMRQPPQASPFLSCRGENSHCLNKDRNTKICFFYYCFGLKVFQFFWQKLLWQCGFNIFFRVEPYFTGVIRTTYIFSCLSRPNFACEL